MLFQEIFLSLLQCPEVKIYNLINFLEEIRHSLDANAEHSSWTWEMTKALDVKVCGPQVFPGKSRGQGLIKGLPMNLYRVPEALWKGDSEMSQARKAKRKEVIAGWHHRALQTSGRLERTLCPPSHLSDRLLWHHTVCVHVTLILLHAGRKAPEK